MIFLYLLFIITTPILAKTPGNETECNQTFASIVTNITIAIYTKNYSNLVLPPGMIDNSGRGINDLGSYDACNQMTSTRYMLMKVYALGQSFNIGFCGPVVCEEDSLNALSSQIAPFLSLALNMLYNTSGIAVYPAFQDPALQHPDMDGGAVVVLIVVCILIAFCLVGTGYEIYEKVFPKSRLEDALAYKPLPDEINATPESKLTLFFKSFSIITNSEKIFSVKPGIDQNLDIFNGVRFFSMSWVVVGHTYMLRLMMSYNTDYIGQIMKNPGFSTLIGQALYAVDVFFFLGGFFVAFVLVPKFISLKKVQPQLFGQIYFHRIYRIWPSYVLCLLIYYKLSVYVWSGPVWGNFNFMTTNVCSDKWWTNVLYIDNLFGRDTSQYCFAWGWYLSNDFQMFLVSPFLLFLYSRRKKLGVLAMILVLGLSFLASFLVSYLNHFKSDHAMVNSDDNREFFNLYYSKPWIRCDVYILGLLAACFYLEYKQNKEFCLKLKTWLANSYIVHLLCYVFGLLILNLIFWCGVNMQKSQDIHYWNDTDHVLYLVFNRSIFVFGFLLVILPGLLTGKDIVHSILSFKAFAPLGRLTYCTYLVHLIVVARTTFGTKNSFYANHETFIYVALADLVFSLMAGYILSVVAEAPLLNLEKNFIFKQKKENKKIENKNDEENKKEPTKQQIN